MNQQEVVAYSPVKAALADLEHKYKAVVFDVSTPAGMSTAKAAYKDINAYSIMLEAARVKEKADSLAYGRFVDSEAKRIADQLDALRLPIKNQIDEVAKAEQRAREAAIKEAQDRIIAEIARQQAEIARAQREAEEAARASRARIEADERAARQAREEADRAARREREEAEAAAKRIRDAEEARLKAERDRIDAEARALAEAKRAEQQRIDDAARKVRDEQLAQQRELERKRAFEADTAEYILTLRQRIQGNARYAGIAAAIDEYLAQKVPA